MLIAFTVGAFGEAPIPLAPALDLFSVMIVGMNFVYVWLRIRSGSLWPGVFMHAAHNLFLMQVFAPLTEIRPAAAWAAGEFGIGLAIAGIVCAVIFWRRAN